MHTEYHMLSPSYTLNTYDMHHWGQRLSESFPNLHNNRQYNVVFRRHFPKPFVTRVMDRCRFFTVKYSNETIHQYDRVKAQCVLLLFYKSDY